MSDDQLRLGDALFQALEKIDPRAEPITLDQSELDLFLAGVERRLAQARAENAAGAPPLDLRFFAPDGNSVIEADMPAFLSGGVSEADMRAFFTGERALSHAQQRLLFTHEPTRAMFQALKREYATPLAAFAEVRILEMPIQIAAASGQDEHFERKFPGGTLLIDPVGIGRQVYVVFQFDDPVTATRALIVEQPRNERAVRYELTSPDAGEIMLVKDLASPEDAELVDCLRDPGTLITFQK